MCIHPSASSSSAVPASVAEVAGTDVAPPAEDLAVLGDAELDPGDRGGRRCRCGWRRAGSWWRRRSSRSARRPRRSGGRCRRTSAGGRGGSGRRPTPGTGPCRGPARLGSSGRRRRRAPVCTTRSTSESAGPGVRDPAPASREVEVALGQGPGRSALAPRRSRGSPPGTSPTPGARRRTRWAGRPAGPACSVRQTSSEPGLAAGEQLTEVADGALGDVREGQERQEAVVGTDRYHPGDVVDVGGDVAVGEHRPLGPARRARRVDDGGQVVEVEAAAALVEDRRVARRAPPRPGRRGRRGRPRSRCRGPRPGRTRRPARGRAARPRRSSTLASWSRSSTNRNRHPEWPST